MKNDIKAVDIVKVQKRKSNTTVSLTKDIQAIFPVEKGEILKATATKDKVVIERVTL